MGRPQTLSELIGQNELKQKARIAIGAALKRGEPLPHVLLTSSGGGLGKTTLAHILADEMYVPLRSTTGQCVTNALNLRNLLVRLKPGSMLLIDEFHGIGKLAGEELLLVLEEGVLNVNLGRDVPVRLAVPPFTLIAATTKPSAISAPLAQRMALRFHFDFYSVEDLKHIVQQAASRMDIAFEDAVSTGIATRALGVPRLALRLADRVRDVAQAKGVITATASELHLAVTLEGIDQIGLHQEHRRILMKLASLDPRPVSARSLALALGVEVATVTEVLEPPLVRLGLLTVGVGGRRITEAGLAHLEAAATCQTDAHFLSN
ncbi:MAG TPA: Holliday junction DNA helicase RuvB C-terminal domain-containing protein [Phycisphaerae bacterium]|nr:Holliday junction DNA helicase RuvB C-terminal domain-containing protein [Phycisphaerae bacterium]